MYSEFSEVYMTSAQGRLLSVSKHFFSFILLHITMWISTEKFNSFGTLNHHISCPMPLPVSEECASECSPNLLPTASVCRQIQGHLICTESGHKMWRGSHRQTTVRTFCFTWSVRDSGKGFSFLQAFELIQGQRKKVKYIVCSVTVGSEVNSIGRRQKWCGPR